MRRGSPARAGGRSFAAAREGSGEASSLSQTQPVRRPSNSATCERTNRSAWSGSTERLSSRAITFKTESSRLRRSRSPSPPRFPTGPAVASSISGLQGPIPGRVYQHVVANEPGGQGGATHAHHANGAEAPRDHDLTGGLYGASADLAPSPRPG